MFKVFKTHQRLFAFITIVAVTILVQIPSSGLGWASDSTPQAYLPVMLKLLTSTPTSTPTRMLTATPTVTPTPSPLATATKTPPQIGLHI
jgi:hypothetical protein